MQIPKKISTFAVEIFNNNMSHLSKAQIKWVRQLQQKKFRDAEGVFVAEGEKCVNDLRQSFELLLHITPDNASSTEIEQMSSLRTPQGVIGVFRKRKDQVPTPTKLSDGQLLLALDGIQDPGNLGTIIRTCDWFGIYDILCTKDTADCYNPKVVQATMGALSRVKVHYVDLPMVLDKLNMPIYVTALDGDNLYDATLSESGIIVMGNEGNGVSDQVQALATRKLLIPNFPVGRSTSESLNVGVATAVVCAEFRRRQL